nr:hypothetical protein [Tanacetum cinerariifolium]
YGYGKILKEKAKIEQNKHENEKSTQKPDLKIFLYSKVKPKAH